MKVAIILGNKLLPDGKPSALMLKRAELAASLYRELSPDKIILSGGATERSVPLTEAEVLFGLLTEKGVPPEVLITETEAVTTAGNARKTVPIAMELGAGEIIICSSAEHISRRYLNPVKLFMRALKRTGVNKDTALSVYTDDPTSGETKYVRVK
ncbi:MAG: YdcF family protein [Clostridiaceae bacterium]|nr:YdcF family protein [Clostridiaceae bacterium]